MDMVTVIKDVNFRATVIKTIEQLEKAWATGKINKDTNINNTSAIGIVTTITIKEIKPDKPLIFTINHHLEMGTFKEWLQSIKYMLGGPMIFTHKNIGIEVCIPYGPDKPEKVGFSIEGANNKLWLNLIKEDTQVTAHREVIGEKEWEIFLNV